MVTDLTMKEPQVTIEHIHPADNAGVQVVKEVVRMKFNKQLKRLCSDYVAGQRSMLSFLRAVGETIRFIG